MFGCERCWSDKVVRRCVVFEEPGRGGVTMLRSEPCRWIGGQERFPYFVAALPARVILISWPYWGNFTSVWFNRGSIVALMLVSSITPITTTTFTEVIVPTVRCPPRVTTVSPMTVEAEK